MRAVDLDLFVNSASKGWNDGAKVDSPFAAFLNGVSQGIDQNFKNDQLAAQTEKIRIENEQAPYQEAILEAKAEKAKIEIEAMRENPDAFKESIITKAETEKKALEQAAVLQQKATTFSDIMSKGTSAEKAQATLGGEYNDLFAQKPEYLKMAERTVPSWDAPDKEKFFAADREKVVSNYYAERELKNEALYQEAEKNFNKDTGVAALANTLKAPIPDLLNKGEVKRELIGEIRKEAVIDPKTKQQAIVNGVPQFKLAPKDTGDMKWQDVFYYDGAPVYNADPETLKVFTSYQEPWKIKNKRAVGQDGVGTIKEESAKVDDARVLEKSAAQEQAKVADASKATAREQFLSGVGVANKYGTVAQATPPTPQTPQSPTQSPIARAANAVERSGPVVVSPVQTPTPSSTSTGQSLTPTPTPIPSTAMSGTPTPTADQQNKAFSVRQKEELARAKAQAALQRRRSPTAGSIGTPQATPQQQAAKATEPKTIPQNISVNISDEYPNDEVVANVLSVPALQDASAFVKAVAAVESRGNPNAVSPTGVTGLMQTTLGTAQDIDPSIKSREELKNAETSARIGSIRLESLYKTYPKAPILALIGYNGGPGVAAEIARQVGVEASWEAIQAAIPSAVEKYYGKGSPKIQEVMNYPKRVMSYFPKFLRVQSDMVLADTLKDQGVISYT